MNDRTGNIKPAIVVVAYRRLHTLKRLLQSIENGIYREDDITLIISIDHHPDNHDVIACAQNFNWKHGNKIVKTHEQNLGLRKHIIECGNYSVEYGAAIVLEDDEIVAPGFYEYTKAAQDYYKNNDRIAGVSLYAHEWNGYAGKKFQPIQKAGDVYFGQFSCTRGQSWSAGQWTAFKMWYEKNPEIEQDEFLPSSIYKWKESWGKYFARYVVESDKYYVMPYRPVATVFGETGTHARKLQYDVQVALYWGTDKFRFVPFEDGVHYDIFFENTALKEILAQRYNISDEEICIDLYALRGRKYVRKRYVLTTRRLNCAIIAQYDLNLRPHDANILLNAEGNGIFLYDLQKYQRNKKYCMKNRLEYDFAGMRGPAALWYGWIHCWEVIFNSFHIGK